MRRTTFLKLTFSSIPSMIEFVKKENNMESVEKTIKKIFRKQTSSNGKNPLDEERDEEGQTSLMVACR